MRIDQVSGRYTQIIPALDVLIANGITFLIRKTFFSTHKIENEEGKRKEDKGEDRREAVR